MGAKLRIHTKPFAGDYDLDLDDAPLTTLEWRWIKKISGYLPATIGEGIQGGDPDINLALAIVALNRSGRVADSDVYDAADRLAKAPVDALEEIPDPSEVREAADFSQTRVTDLPITNTGKSGRSTLANPDDPPPNIGNPDSLRSAISDRSTSLG